MRQFSCSSSDMAHPGKVAGLPQVEHLAFWALLAAGIFTVLLSSPNVLGKWCVTYTKGFICILPWLLLWAAYEYGGELLARKTYRVEIWLICLILGLSALNVMFSDEPGNSYYSMIVFLSSGLMTLWAAMFLITDPGRRNLFAWFCCACLSVIALLEMLAYFLTGGMNPDGILIFANNPIPVGTVVILLAPGPFFLILSDSPGRRVAGWALVGLGVGLIFLTERRGSILAVVAMLLAWAFFYRRRLGYLLAAVFLTSALLIPYRGLTPYKSLDQNIPSHFNILHRLELYPFAWHILKKHPFLGIGYRPQDLDRYLVDYQQYNQDLEKFAATVKEKTTLDSMLLTSVVELGPIMTVLYLGLVSYIIFAYIRRVWPISPDRREDFFRLLPLLGLAIHSLTYDSLTFPQVNWLFHVQLGILAGFKSESD